MDVLTSLGPQSETQCNYSIWVLILGDTNRGEGRSGQKDERHLELNHCGALWESVEHAPQSYPGEG